MNPICVLLLISSLSFSPYIYGWTPNSNEARDSCANKHGTTIQQYTEQFKVNRPYKNSMNIGQRPGFEIIGQVLLNLIKPKYSRAGKNVQGLCCIFDKTGKIKKKFKTNEPLSCLYYGQYLAAAVAAHPSHKGFLWCFGDRDNCKIKWKTNNLLP